VFVSGARVPRFIEERACGTVVWCDVASSLRACPGATSIVTVDIGDRDLLEAVSWPGAVAGASYAACRTPKAPAAGSCGFGDQAAGL
jgi:hypothetical protein